MDNNKSNKAVVILGPTASGKTKLGVDLAYRLNGEIINADSRQVYKKMDVGTGKDLDEYRIKEVGKNGKEKVLDIPYHLIDVVHPNTSFNLSKYQKLAYKKIKEVLNQDKLPIMVGGTGLYLQAVVEGFDLGGAAPDVEDRKKLENMDVNQLWEELLQINSVFANKLNNSDRNNKRRLTRYIEICRAGKGGAPKKRGGSYELLLLGVTFPREELDQRIYKRLVERIEKEGMIEEVRNLHKKEEVSWKRLKQFGLEYRYVVKYLQGELEYEEMIEKLYIATRQFARRQMTWFRQWQKRGAKIHWVDNKQQARKFAEKFLKEKRRL